MRRTIVLALIGLFPGLACASDLRLECTAQQGLPGRALVCEYFMLERMNGQLADLHERVVHAGRAGRIELKRWLAERDACRDVECLDHLFEAGIREAKLALVDVESRQPTPILTNARGVPLRLMEKASPPAAAVEQTVQESPAHARAGGAYATLLLLAVVVAYVIVARRLSA